ncbi:MAG TPA: arginine--tRNA ligase [Candidatus Saccharimonadales bacterium]|nr:arginine--tRNA ligase [Candidatus Saccharimonadales bacterium]
MRIEELRQAVKTAAQKLFQIEIEPEISRPDEKFGDYATNAALQLAKETAGDLRQIAQQLAAELRNIPGLEEVGVAGPGFLNFRLTDEALTRAADASVELSKPLEGQEILVEFGDANPFKEMHIGHLYSLIVGDAIASLLSARGARVRRLGYHGDVGRHVAMAIWGMQRHEGPIGQCYAAGAKAFAEDERAKTEIQAINEHIYKQDDPKINELYEKGRAQSLSEFDKIYETLGLKYDRDYFESESTPVGIKFVEEHRDVFKESDGALVYEGEKVGLHTRVFITSKGLPTYETKDLGLAELKNRDFPEAARSIIITANEQSEYFKVMLAALAEIDPALAKKTTHLAHGFLSLTSGKMSSRSGNVYTAADLLDSIKAAVEELYPDSRIKNDVYLSAVKYTFLKHRLGQDVVIDPKESASLEGNSGPYLQYAHARACSILAKTEDRPSEAQTELDENERRLARKIGEYPEIIAKATAELMPHHICTYLYELAQVFNSFYETSRIIGDEREALRLKLVKTYSQVLKSGLNILNVTAPERM